jgi:hypothetical protein
VNRAPVQPSGIDILTSVRSQDQQELSQFSQFGMGTPRFFFWSCSMCFNINFVHFLLKVFLQIIISLWLLSHRKKYWCQIEEDPERIRDPESSAFDSVGIRDLEIPLDRDPASYYCTPLCMEIMTSRPMLATSRQIQVDKVRFGCSVGIYTSISCTRNRAGGTALCVTLNRMSHRPPATAIFCPYL